MYSIAIISDVHDWHSQQLESQLKKKKCSVVKIEYNKLIAHFTNRKKFFFNPKLKNINGIWLRFINNGTLEEITTKLTFLHLLDEAGIYIHNSASAIEMTVDKVRTTGLLKINEISSPETQVMIGSFKKCPQKKYLLKPIFGSQGKHISLIKNSLDLKKKIPVGNVSYLQEFLGNLSDREFTDIRVLVSNHKPISIMQRTSKKIYTNVYQGASIQKINLNEEIINISKKVSKLFRLGYGGIDLKFHNKKYYVLEVNSIPSWKAMQKIENMNISEVLVNDFLKKVEKNVS